MELKEALVDEVVSRGPATSRRTVLLLERGHRDAPGIERGTLESYVEAFADRRDFEFDPEGFRSELEATLVDDEEWVEESALYRFDDDRISRYPASWHDALGGSDDVAAFLGLLADTDFAESVGQSGASEGIDEEALLDVVAAVGRIPIDEAKANLESLRDEGIVVEDADQHPHAGVYLSEEADGMRDPALEDS